MIAKGRFTLIVLKTSQAWSRLFCNDSPVIATIEYRFGLSGYREIDMGKTLAQKSGKRKKSKGFNPNREYLDSAVKDYLQRGGKITKVIEVPEDGELITRFRENCPPADEFLMGN